jgi:hypothetical protein
MKGANLQIEINRDPVVTEMVQYSVRPSEAMWPAMHALKALKVRFRVASAHHLKVGKINYWPGKKRIYVDGQPASMENQSLEDFLRFLASSLLQDAIGVALERPPASTM